MAFRSSVLAALAACLVAAPGCSLPRAVLAGGGPGIDGGTADVGGGGRDTGPGLDAGPGTDTGPRPDGGPDGGSTCPTSCDDGEPCTADGCDAAGNCTHTNSAAACDDGVLCNGADSCGGGTCSVHDGVDPCPGMSHCDAAMDACTGCRSTADCPVAVPGAWGACDFGSDLCATTGGTQTRSVTGFACSHGTCEGQVTMEMQACTRPSTDGNMCAAGTFGDWSACDFGTDPCTQAGTQTRIATTSHCLGGACTAMDMAESQACMRATDGMPCGMPMTSDWSACMVGATCALMGTQTRTTTTPTCTGGACVVASSSESQACTSGTVVGSTCGATTCTAWGACTQTMPNTCDRTGVQQRTCTTPTCSGSGGSAGCTGSTTTTESQPCSASVGGVSCTTTSCGSCREPGRLDCRSGHMGQQRCTRTNGTCMDWGLGPFCAGLGGMTFNRSCSC